MRIVLDNHSAHISKETRAHHATRPNLFIYVQTPKHGSWIISVKTLFGKMAWTFLKYIRGQSVKERKDRILLDVEEINAVPIAHHRIW